MQEDIDASILGVGDFRVPVGETDYEIVVTASNGETKIYTISLTRAASSNPFLKGIKMNGVMLEDFDENTMLEARVVTPNNVFSGNLKP